MIWSHTSHTNYELKIEVGWCREPMWLSCPSNKNCYILNVSILIKRMFNICVVDFADW